MGFRFKISYHKRLYGSLVIYSLFLLGCFAIFQYHREKEFKADEMDSRLQVLNEEILAGMAEGKSIGETVAAIKTGFPELRISLISRNGRLMYDTFVDSLPETNHLSRQEVRDALRNGTGFDLRRHSESTGKNFFYSARATDRYVIRTAVPYSVSLHQLLAADYAFLWFMSAVTAVMCIIGFFATRRLGRNVERLNEFAEKAERGESFFDTEPFPNNELGNISNHIVLLYSRLQKALYDRDAQHKIALREERDKIRIKHQLTNNINHELKTPVASIRACIETLINHPDMEQEKRLRFLAGAGAACERLGSLLSDVSLITRMDYGGDAIAREKVNIDQIAAAACADFEIIAAEKGVAIQNGVKGTSPVNGNASLMMSVFHNLIDNAIRYSGCRHIQLKTIKLDGGKQLISVSDDGCGVPAVHIPHLFERFYRLEKGRSRSLGGTGLGLAIVKNAVLWHGGDIHVVINQSGGLTFNITLPSE